ncbi:stm1 domain-containing protein [Apiospora arundinis]
MLLRILIFLLSIGLRHVYSRPANSSLLPGLAPLLASRDSDDPSDLSWVRRWAAIGDSFTAGIGAGERLGSPVHNNRDWVCSRYTYSWVQIVNKALGKSVTDFQFLACSGDRTPQIYDQAKAISGKVDLVMMTAGGNDLCLAAMLKQCVFLAWDGEKSCQDVIDKAQSNIDSILKPNIQQVIDALDDKVNDNGVVVYAGYAPFFNTDNGDCGDSQKQNWAIFAWKWRYFFGSPLSLSIERRKKFNTLVENINKAIRETVESNDGKKKYRLAYADWADWPGIVDGQMCSPNDDGTFPNSKQPNMHFYKRDTRVKGVTIHDGLKKRDLNDTTAISDKQTQWYASDLGAIASDDLYESLLYQSRNPRAEALHLLDSRAPSPAGCPGDGLPNAPLGIGLPDSFARNFHPNSNGHESMAAFALQTVVWKRAQMLGKDACKVKKTEEIICWSDLGTENQPYAGKDLLDDNRKDFCENHVKPENGQINWKAEWKYNKDTYEEHDFYMKLDNNAKDFNKDDCLAAFDKIINSCDTDESANPMHWKHGGRYVRGDYTYEINPRWFRPFQTRADGECNGVYKFWFADYDISGSGWNGRDSGKAFLDALKGCMGLGVTRYNFQYCANKADCQGWEWHVNFRTPIWVGRCFDKNYKAAKKVGGYHHKFKGSGYDDAGCGGSA